MDVARFKPQKKASVFVVVGAIVIAGIAFFLGKQGRDIEVIQRLPAQSTHNISSAISANTTKEGLSLSKDFDAWRLECFKDQRPCRIFQRLILGKGKAAQRILTAVIVIVPRKIPKQKKIVMAPTLRLLTPNGVFLPAGMTIEFDPNPKEAKNSKKIIVPYLVCNPTGCMAERLIGKEFMTKIQSGNVMSVGFLKFNNGVAMPLKLNVSLKGSKSAIKTLIKQVAQKK